MDSKICFEMSVFVVEAIRGRCASFMIETATVSEICGGQTNVPILVVIDTTKRDKNTNSYTGCQCSRAHECQ